MWRGAALHESSARPGRRKLSRTHELPDISAAFVSVRLLASASSDRPLRRTGFGPSVARPRRYSFGYFQDPS